MQLLFCLFADSVGLLPNRVFRRLIDSDNRFYPAKFMRMIRNLFSAMAERDGIFGEYAIRYFNGGLFKSADTVIELDKTDLGILHEAATRYNWAHIAPAIFGTLFERSLDGSLIGAHYTSEEDISLLVEPVVMRPLEQRWAHVRASILVTLGIPAEATAETAPSARHIPAWAEGPGGTTVEPPRAEGPTQKSSSGSETPGAPSVTAPSSRVGSTESNTIPLLSSRSAAEGSASTPKPRTAPKSRSLLHSNPEAEHLLAAWLDELAAVRILDPACGSGNFLYVALRRLLDLWKEAYDFAI